MKLTYGCRHLTPLQHSILGDAAVGVDVNALVFIANQNLCSSAVWQNDDGMRTDGTLDLWTKTNKHTKKCLAEFFAQEKRKQNGELQRVHTYAYILTSP